VRLKRGSVELVVVAPLRYAVRHKFLIVKIEVSMTEMKIHKHDYRVTVRFPLIDRFKQIFLLLMIGEVRYWLGEDEVVKHNNPDAQ